MRGTWERLLIFGWSAAVLLLADPAGAAPTHQIRVNLFGQPCILQGPVEDKVLQIIHSLSPEQLYPAQDSPMTGGPTRKALEKLKSITNAPAALDRYRDRLTRRLEAQLALLTAAESYRKDPKAAPILAVGKKHLTGAKEKQFEAAVKKAEPGKKLATGEVFESLFDVYSEGIEGDPEEEFHRAIQRIKVQYTCSFEESGEASGESSDAP